MDFFRPIWKLESNIPEEANQGEFAIRYLIATVTNKPMYLGRCSCKMATTLNTPIITSKKTATCIFCNEEVELQPIPRIWKDKWIGPKSSDIISDGTAKEEDYQSSVPGAGNP